MWATLFLLAGALFAQDAAPDEIRVMTFNLWYGGEGGKQPIEQTVEAIKTARADIVGLQETRGWKGDNSKKIADALGWHHFDQGGGTAVISRFRIMEATPAKWGVTIDLGNHRKLFFFNAHLAHAPYQPYQLLKIPYHNAPFLSTEDEAVEAAKKARGGQVRRLLAELNVARMSGVPVVLTGDFNEPSHQDWTEAAAKAKKCPLKVEWPTTRAITNAGMTDAYRSAHPNEVESPGITWTPTTAPDDPNDRHDRIDYIFTAGLRVTACEVVGEDTVKPWPSDHRAVVATLRMKQEMWRPEKTWVFAVGVLEWKDSTMWSPFPKENRRDAELVEEFRKRGVPAERIVFLKDAEATRERIEKSLTELLAKTATGDTLFLYYAGHGSKDDSGVTYFANYDAGKDLQATAWSVPSIFDALDKKFNGSMSILTADCCYSGALVQEAERRKRPWACLTSSLASAASTANWTFTECLLAGLRGDPLVDANGDGAIEFDELAKYTYAEMVFVEEQLALSRAVELQLAKAERRAQPRVGERVEALHKDAWSKAKILQVDGERIKVRFLDGVEAWVGKVRAFKPHEYKVGTAVEVEWNGKWYPAKILDVREGLHWIRYDGYSDVWDEWVSSKRIRPGGEK